MVLRAFKGLPEDRGTLLEVVRVYAGAQVEGYPVGILGRRPDDLIHSGALEETPGNEIVLPIAVVEGVEHDSEIRFTCTECLDLTFQLGDPAAQLLGAITPRVCHGPNLAVLYPVHCPKPSWVRRSRDGSHRRPSLYPGKRPTFHDSNGAASCWVANIHLADVGPVSSAEERKAPAPAPNAQAGPAGPTSAFPREERARPTSSLAIDGRTPRMEPRRPPFANLTSRQGDGPKNPAALVGRIGGVHGW
jgi:hypothetical protein